MGLQSLNRILLLGSYTLIKYKSKGLVLPCLEVLNLVKLFFISVVFVLHSVLQKCWSFWSVCCLFFLFCLGKTDAITEDSAGKLCMCSA